MPTTKKKGEAFAQHAGWIVSGVGLLFAVGGWVYTIGVSAERLSGEAKRNDVQQAQIEDGRDQRQLIAVGLARVETEVKATRERADLIYQLLSPDRAEAERRQSAGDAVAQGK